MKDDVGDVDILVNNAGIVTGRKLLDTSDTADALMVKTMEVNSISHFWVISHTDTARRKGVGFKKQTNL